MAEKKSALLAKSVQKHAGRAKEKILQNLGKVDRTADEIFDDHINNFNRQQANANKLQKEFSNYIRCIRSVQTASKSLMDAICEAYEPQWSGSDALLSQVSAIDVMWQDFSHKLGDQVLIPLNTYTAQFPEMKKKIEKRNRKLIDYDSQRHSFQGLQANAAKRKGEVKLIKGREQLEDARRTFEILNTELHDELPALHDSRILCLVSNLQTLFASEQVFHSETSKIYSELEAIVDKLATDSQRGSYTNSIKKISGISNQTTPPQSPSKINNNSNVTTPVMVNNNNNYTNAMTNGGSNVNSLVAAADAANTTSTTVNPTPTATNTKDESPAATIATTTITSSATIEATIEATTTTVKTTETGKEGVNDVSNNNDIASNINGTTNSNNSIITNGATTTDLPPGVLYRVKATYKYIKEDQDELSFEVGDIIRVIEYDDPEDQEEGWLMGEKEGSTEKGLFPANFTRPL